MTAPPPQRSWGGSPYPHRTRLNPAALFRISPHGRPFADRRFWFPGHPADRPPPARSRGLLRNPPLPVGRPGQAEAVRPQGHRALGRPGLGDRGPGARGRPRHLRRQRARPGHLLRRADHGPAARRHGRGGPPPRVRPRRACGQAALGPVRRRVAAGRQEAGLDEPRRSRDQAAAGLQRHRHLGERALRRHLRRGAQVLRRAVPSRGDAHARRRQAFAQLRAQDRGLQGRLDDGRLQGPRHRPGPRPGRQRPRDLRPVGRRRLLGGGRAAARGDRRPAAVRVRRPRPAAAERGRAGRAPVPRPLQHPAGPCRRLRAVPEGARRRERPRDQAQDDRRAVHRRVRGGGEEDRRRAVPGPGHALSRRDRIRSPSPAAPRSPSRAITMSAACRPA